jgi:biopolymer transport protein ExbD
MQAKKSKVSDEIPSFLVTTVFPKDRGLAIVLPEEAEEIQVSQKNILHLIIQPTGIVDVKRGESQQIQQMRPDDVESLWRQEVTSNPNLIAAVKTHPDASYRYMIDVLDALHVAGAERISLQVLEN